MESPLDADWTEIASIDVACPSEAEARAIAVMAVDTRIAACAHVSQISSIFRWESEVTESTEFLVSLKTRAAYFDFVEQLVSTMHSYALPAIVSTTVDKASLAFCEWVMSATSDPILDSL